MLLLTPWFCDWCSRKFSIACIFAKKGRAGVFFCRANGNGFRNTLGEAFESVT